VVLTQGKRPEELLRAVRSVLAQRGVVLDCVVVGNGWEPTGLPDGVRALALPENLGIPAGRNAGVPHVRGDLLLFVDDDAALATDDLVARAAAMFTAEPQLGLMQPRVADPQGRPAPSRWTPRLGRTDPTRSSDVTAIWEGVCLARRTAFEACGGWGDRFFYGHEGIELAWRIMDAGFRVRYEASLVAHHDAKEPRRHSFYYFMTVRNRVWIARRNLPVVFAVPYVSIWTLATLVGIRRPAALAQAMRGLWHGLSRPCGRRRPVSWRTVWRMTQAGRPPVV
jgi:GT2 family glycosyltransferase